MTVYTPNSPTITARNMTGIDLQGIQSYFDHNLILSKDDLNHTTISAPVASISLKLYLYRKFIS
jgi:hypothetical protein